ncbi:MAG: hypothetical protein IPK15_07120 [Verrucomicrobia bacterium]|nr:hypothetical protein [Verrucomicrobiota bacterium]
MILANLVSFVPLLDMGFLPSIARSISYAMAGAKELKAHGTESPSEGGGQPNFPLLWQLLSTTRRLYQLLALVVFVGVGAWGTFAVGLKINETTQPEQAWLAWWMTLAGVVFEMYSGWWSTYLRGLNQVLAATRILAAAYLLRLLLAAILLLAGAGLLSVPIAALISSFVLRSLSRRLALRFLNASPQPEISRGEVSKLLRILWPNSWRVGVHCLSNSLLIHLNVTVLCPQLLGLEATGQYGLSLQVVTVMQGMASVWLLVKWPIIGQYISRQDWPPLRTLVRQRLLLQYGTYAIMAIVAVPVAPLLLEAIKSNKTLIPLYLAGLSCDLRICRNALSSWATLVSLGNRLPYLSFTVATNIVGLVLSFLLFAFTDLEIGALVIGPLLAGTAHNYWRWPREGCRVLHTSWVNLFAPRRAS